MKRPYSKYTNGSSLCLGTCGKMVRPHKSNPADYPGMSLRYSRGMCWSCFRKDSPAEAVRVFTPTERAVKIELDAYLTARRRRGVPAGGAPLRRTA